MLNRLGLPVIILCIAVSFSFAQAKPFRVKNGIPHFPAIDNTALVSSPVAGMMVFCRQTGTPLAFDGNEWASFCDVDISQSSASNFFIVKNGIPCLPVKTQPVGLAPPGAFFYSIDIRSLCVFTGIEWVSLNLLPAYNIFESNEFKFSSVAKTCKLPLLAANPSDVEEGAFYINTIDRCLRYYNGLNWQDINCQPIVKTLDVSAITGISVQANGEVVSAGGSSVTETGFCWNTQPTPDITLPTKLSLSVTSPGIGAFSGEINNLLPAKTYYVRSFAINNEGIFYGNEVSFNTLVVAPIVQTMQAENINFSSATLGGKIISDGGNVLTSKGMIWSEEGDPLVFKSNVITDVLTDSDVFSATIHDLTGNTRYFARAFAENAHGKSYGELVEFSTLSPVAPILDLTVKIENITDISAAIKATILDRGGDPITERGICWSTDQVLYNFIESDQPNIQELGEFLTRLTMLQSNVVYYVKAYAKNSIGIGYSNEASFSTAALAPITTHPVVNISGTTAISGGTILNTGNSIISARGICWSSSPDPTIDLSSRTGESISNDGTGSFTSNLTGLLPGTTYYVRAYVINAIGVSYGQQEIFTTLDYARISTLSASLLGSNNATSGGNITSDGGSPIHARGVCWSTSENPTIAGMHTSDGDGTGIFSSLITGIEARIVYHIRAYAINQMGIAYGEDKSFIIIPEAPMIKTLNPTDITSIAALSGGDISSDGGAPITSRGILWSTQGDPTDDENAIITDDGSGVGLFPSTLNNLLANTTYFVRAYAVNKYGKAYGNLIQFTTPDAVPPLVSSPNIYVNNITNNSAQGEVTILNNGGARVTERGICWSTDRVHYTFCPSLVIKTTDIGTFPTTLTELSSGTTYFIKGYAKNAAGTGFSSETSFITTSLPVLTTTGVSHITGTTAQSGGDVTNTSDVKLLARGVCWSTEEHPTIDLPTKTSVYIYNEGLGSFSSSFEKLSPGTTYYVRAYATNSFGTAYGNQVTFTTAEIPTVITAAVSGINNVSATCGGTVTSDGRLGVSNRGICWSPFPNPTLGNSSTYSGYGTGTYVSQLNDLLGNTTYYVRAYAVNGVGIAYGNMQSFTTQPAGLPVVSSVDVIEIGGTTAIGRGNVIKDNGALVTERGVCWNTAGKPTINDQYASSGEGKGLFSASVTGLTPTTQYYMRAYAVNSVGISYGEEVVFSTFTTATLKTALLTEVTSTSSKGGGEIISDGGTPVTTSGICWNTSGTPTIYDLRTVSGVGIGSFIHRMDNLMGSTTYYVRAYAINKAGVSYGNQETVTTAPPISPSLITSAGQSNSDGVSLLCGGAIVSNGGASIETVGLCWSKTSGFNPEEETINRISRNGDGSFTESISGLDPGTRYFIRAFASNSVGIAYAPNEVAVTTFNLPEVITNSVNEASITSMQASGGGIVSSDGGAELIASGLCWSTHSTPTVADSYFENAPGMGGFTCQITQLMGNTTYYVRAYATNSVGTAYGNVVSFTTKAPVLALIHTSPAEATSSITASCGGTIVNNGGAVVTTRGICWSTQANFDPTSITDTKTASTGYFVGAFSSEMIGLSPNTVYYVRAYVENSVGIAYGEEVSFSTPELPSVISLQATSAGSTQGTIDGEVTSDGGALVAERGTSFSTVASFDPQNENIDRVSSGGGTGPFSTRLSGLKGNTTYYARTYATNIAGTTFGNLVSFTTDPAQLAKIITTDAIDITGSTAICGGAISDDGGSPVATRGIVWSIVSGFRPDTVVVCKLAQVGTGEGVFTALLNNLKKGTRYYVRAYAINEIGTSFGNEVSFITFDVPQLVTQSVYPSDNGYAASGGGTIVSNGGSPLLNQGVCWSTNSMPTIGLHTKTSGDQLSQNAFVSLIEGLNPVTHYYLRAYAVNEIGTAYGNQVEFTTPPARPTVFTSIAIPANKSSVSTGGDVSNDGGDAVTVRGVIWSTNADFNPEEELINRTYDGTGTGSFQSMIGNLEMSITYYIRAYATNGAGTSYGNQVTVAIFPTAPLVVTQEITAISGFSAECGGDITSDGGADVSLKGICWSTHPNPTISDSKTSNGSGTESFRASLSGLAPNTRYYVRAYAVNKIGTAYGIEREFITHALPTLSATLPAFDINSTIASSGGEITDEGRTPVTIRGICWSLYSNPTTSLSTKTIDNSTSGTGSFTALMQGLSPEKTYYVRAYATNQVGTNYGSQISFSTLPVRLPTLKTEGVTSISSYEATCGGNITDEGGMPVTVRGLCWSTFPAPTTDLPTKTNNATGGAGTYTNTMSGLLPATTYYVRAFAINSKGTAYGEEQSFTTLAAKPSLSTVNISNIGMTSADCFASISATGGDAISDRGFFWSKLNSVPDFPVHPDSILSLGAGENSFSGTIASLTEKTRYFVWAFATNIAGTGYSATPTLCITPTLPTLTTSKPSSIARNTATAGGNITDAGGLSILFRGVCLSLAGLPTIDSLNIQHSSAGTGNYSVNISGLKEGTKYYIRAYATNGVGTSYGNMDSLITQTIPSVKTLSPSEITANSAIGGGEVISDGGAAVSVRGICWSLSPDPEISISSKISCGSGSGLYSGSVTGLTYATKYYIRAYATNIWGTAYGKTESLTTEPIIPEVGEVTIVMLDDITAKGEAEITNDGGAEILSRGICWNNSGDPTVEDNCINDGTGTGILSALIENMEEGPTYYIRAFASNRVGTAYSPKVKTIKICPPSFDVIHTGGLNGAPASKIVTYHSVSSDISGQPLCWLTQNLGADMQASSANDASMEAAGWYWQFNRSQGYQHDGAMRVPSNAWTPWVNSISESSNWINANDPCNLLLGLGWRLPTSAEWMKADGAPQNWTKLADVFSSDLKLHAAGMLNSSAGTLVERGTNGRYWSSTQNGYYYNGDYLLLTSSASSMNNESKACAMPVRCVRDKVIKSAPSVSDVVVPTEMLTSTTALAKAAIANDGGEPVTNRGFCWNTTGDPTINDFSVNVGIGTGDISATISSLVEGETYYIRAFAINNIGITYSSVSTLFRICPAAFPVIHTQGLNGAPESKTITYHSVNSAVTGVPLCWLTQNLGAEKQAGSATDNSVLAAGWYWQFNRSQGYNHDGATLTPSNAWTPWINSISESSNWLAANDPCNLLLGLGWRMPTSSEWTKADAPPQNWTKLADAYNSELKLHAAGMLNSSNGSLMERGTNGRYWSSTQNGYYYNGDYLLLTSTASSVNNEGKPYAMSVRCVRDKIIKSAPTVSNVEIPPASLTNSTAEAKATIASDGGDPVTERGFCWNMTGNPSLTDQSIQIGTGTGDISGILSELEEGATYFVRAYAINKIGTTYSASSTSFKICPASFKMIHSSGLNGAPESKTVTYHSVSSNISGETLCWLTQNLGADVQAVTATDNTEAAAGWYWQFNRSQGYKHDGSVRVPSYSWIPWVNSISESSNWNAANDPCNLLLGKGWRLPTSAEWTKADAPPQNWSNLADAFGSVLNLHAAGLLNYSSSNLQERGVYGRYWSSTQNGYYYNGNYLLITSSASSMGDIGKSYALPVRCVLGQLVKSAPVVSNAIIPVELFKSNSVTANATVVNDGGELITERGFCWNTSGAPTIGDKILTLGTGTGDISGVLENLEEGPVYYVRAFATNKFGTTYSPADSRFMLCPASFERTHGKGVNGAPDTKAVLYHSVSSNISGSPMCWLTQNLGAQKQAEDFTDNSEEASGWYWQFNLSQGYKHDGASRTPSNTWLSSIGQSSNWTIGNDPCNLLLGEGWRLPTYSEWTNADGPPQNWTTSAQAFNSVLKLHAAGYLSYNSGAIQNRGVQGRYWSSSQCGYYYNGYSLELTTGSTLVEFSKAYALPVRCVRDKITKTAPSVSNVEVPSSTTSSVTAEAKATVLYEGGEPVSQRGFCWSTEGIPTLEKNVVLSGDGYGNFTSLITGLMEGPTYYIRAFATNSIGTSYSPVAYAFKLCPPVFEIEHTAGISGAPVSKSIQYHSESSSVTGKMLCWLTQNLGAEKQASSPDDATSEAAGWYFQFNRLQGYEHNGTNRYPSVAWPSSISENSNWIAKNDPCSQLIGVGWRVPTLTEWTNADNSLGWKNYSETFNSPMKLHAAGYIIFNTGTLGSRGVNGYYWTSTQRDATIGEMFSINATSSGASNGYKTWGNAIRCLYDSNQPMFQY